MALTRALAPVTDIGLWARGSGPEIVLFVAGALLLTRFATWLGERITARIDAHSGDVDTLVRTEDAKHRHAVAQVVTWAVLVLVYCLAAVLVVQRLGVPLTGFVAPATVAGVSDLLARVGAGAYADEELHNLLLDAPAVMGVGADRGLTRALSASQPEYAEERPVHFRAENRGRARQRCGRRGLRRSALAACR